MRVLSHEFTSRRVHWRACVHARRFVFRASAVRRRDLCVSCVVVSMTRSFKNNGIRRIVRWMQSALNTGYISFMFQCILVQLSL